MPHPPNLTNPSTFRGVALCTILVAGNLAGCAVQAGEQDEWREMSQAVPQEPSETSHAASAHTANSLGDPFLLIAEGPTSTFRASDSNASGPPVESAWAMLSSDSCDVELKSLHIAFLQEEAAPGWLTTVGPVKGVVQEATASFAVVRYQGFLRMQWQSGRPEAVVPAVIVVAMDRTGDQVSVNVDVGWESEHGPANSGFGARGVFSHDPEAIPPRRFGCW
jgi:hypothetical protein